MSTKKQPKALRLADALIDVEDGGGLPAAAAKELRRLHDKADALKKQAAFLDGCRKDWHAMAVSKTIRVQELESQRDALLAALQRIVDWDDEGMMLTAGHITQARAAIADAISR